MVHLGESSMIMKRVILLSLLVCVGIFHATHAILSPAELSQLNQPKNDLDATHLIITTSLITFKDVIQTNNANLLPQINSASKQIDDYYTTASTQLQVAINQAEQNIDSKTGTDRSIALAMAVSILNNIVNPAKANMAVVFSQINSVITNAIGQANLDKALQQAQEAQKEQNEYNQRILTLLQNLQPIISSFSNQSNMIRNAIIKQAQNKTADEDTISTITNNSQSLMKQANQVYATNKFPILASDSSNYVVASFNQLTQYYTDEMAVTVNILNALLTNPQQIESAFAPLAQLGSRILGVNNTKLSEAVKRLPATMTKVTTDVLRQGYNQTVQNLATMYFGAQAASVMQDYRNTKEKVTFNIFLNALQQLVNKYSEPTDVQIGYALVFYNVIIDNFDVLAQELTATWHAQVSVILAVFFAMRGQAALKSMQPGKDNSVLLQNAIDAYNQASQYYTVAAGDQNINLAKTYSSLSSSLTMAQKLLQQGIQQEAANNFNSAINFYTQAAAEFKQAGDAVNATLANFNLEKLNASKNQQDSKTVLNNYVKASKANFIQYMSFISTSSGQTVESFDTYMSLYTNLQDAVNAALQGYENAKTAYESLSAIQIGQSTSQNTNTQLVIVNNSISWLTSMNIALENLIKGDEILRNVSQANSTEAMFNSINQTESFYAKAISAFSDADALYGQYSTQSDIIVLPSNFAQDNPILQATLAKNQSWTWSTVVYRHIAAFYIAIAAKIATNTIVDMQCYSNANMRNQLLSLAMSTFLQGMIQKLKTQTSAIDQLFEQAQQNEKQALAVSAQDWQSDPTAAIYTSKANSLWQSTLTTYAHVYNLGNVDAKNSFMNAVDEYFLAFKAANIPAAYYPSLGQAFILYNKYIFYMLSSDAQSSNQVLSVIEPLIGGFFDIGNSLEQSVSSVLKQLDASLDTLITTSGKQQNFISWQARMEQALNDQQMVINTIAPNTDPSKLQLITKSVDQKSETISYMFNLGNKSINFGNPFITLAQINAQIAAKAFEQQNYIIAYNSYAIATKLYQDQGDATAANALTTQLNLSRTLAAAQQFRDLVLPNKEGTHNIGTIKVANITVPQRYELEVYQQAYPLPVSAGFDALAQATTAAQKQLLQNQLLGMAAILFLYNILKVNGLDINTVIDLNTMNPKSTISPSNLTIVQNAVQQTKDFQTDLQNRINNKTSSLYVTKNDQTYYIGEIYKPIPGVLPTDEQGNSTLPYITYPYALYYYVGAYNLFKPGTQNVNIGGNLYVPGNDTQSAKDVLALIANAYLSVAVSNKAAMSSTTSKASQALNVIKSLNSNDMTIAVSDYIDKYTYIKNYYLNLILLQYDTAYTYYNQYLSNKQYTTNLVSLLADTYVELANTLSTFLVGNPLDSDYSTTALPDIENFYKTAANYYNNADKTKALYEKIGQLYTNAGQQVVNLGNFIYALGFFYRAERIYRNIVSPDASAKQLLENAVLLKIKTMFYGSTQKLQNYADRRFAGQPYSNSQEKRPLITLTLSTGQRTQETFSQLQQKYQMAGTGDIDQGGIDSAELKEYSNIKSEILDGLIFYSAASTAASNELPAQSQTQTTTVSKALNSSDPIASAALDLISTYSTKNNISLTSVEETIQLLESKDFSNKINGGFDQFFQKIQKATSQNDKYIGYSGIMQWANKIYFAFAQVYMHDYLGGEVTADQWADFTEAIKSEEQEIQAPSSLYT